MSDITDTQPLETPYRAAILKHLETEFAYLDDVHFSEFSFPSNDVLESQFRSMKFTIEAYRRYMPHDADSLIILELFAHSRLNVGICGYRLARKFIEQFAGEIRDIICNNKRRTEAAKLTNKKLSPVAASLATLVLGHFGVPEPVAVGVATYVFIVVMEASKGAFCKTTDADIISTLTKVDPRPQPNSWEFG